VKSAVFRADASPEIGLGHVMRCSHLATALVARGWRCCLASNAQTIDYVNASIIWPGPLLTLDSDAAAEPVSFEAHAPQGRWDLLICDHYQRGLDFETACRPFVDKIAIIDDLPTRHHDADYLLDQTYGRREVEYDGLTPGHCRVLTGSDFALLGPSFQKLRATALKRRKGLIKRILVCVGGSNPCNILDVIITAIKDAQLGLGSDIVIGPLVEEPDRIALAAALIEPRPEIHINTRDMAALMTEADVAIGVAGTTSWERCCLGLPALIMTSADNQKDVAAVLSDVGACRLIGDVSDIGADAIARHLSEFVSDVQSVQHMTVAASGICDGQGAAKVAEILSRSS